MFFLSYVWTIYLNFKNLVLVRIIYLNFKSCHMFLRMEYNVFGIPEVADHLWNYLSNVSSNYCILFWSFGVLSAWLRLVWEWSWNSIVEYLKDNHFLGEEPVDIEDLVNIGQRFGPYVSSTEPIVDFLDLDFCFTLCLLISVVLIIYRRSSTRLLI